MEGEQADTMGNMSTVDSSDHELIIAKFRLKLKKIGKTTRPFRYDLSNPLYSRSDKQIQGIRCDRKCLNNYGWRSMTLYKRQYKARPKGKKNSKGKMVV